MNHQIVFATNNPNKLKEIRAILGGEFKVLSLSDIQCEEELPETTETLEGNALQKAQYVFDHYGHECFADDTGLEVNFLSGKPGVRSARYAGDNCTADDNMDKLLNELGGTDNRSAQFRTVIAWVNKSGFHLFEGQVEGDISKERKGEGGFGYDPIFIPKGHQISFAEMSGEEKNAISHRKRATEKFIRALKA
ncbi:MAG TPA: non-canonical purine NTP pyrophosphatase [Flavobacteriales bacterium]|nr:non-canonical purine NTP pyrophosphatase [Flavobacteriales bacterium]